MPSSKMLDGTINPGCLVDLALASSGSGSATGSGASNVSNYGKGIVTK